MYTGNIIVNVYKNLLMCPQINACSDLLSVYKFLNVHKIYTHIKLNKETNYVLNIQEGKIINMGLSQIMSQLTETTGIHANDFLFLLNCSIIVFNIIFLHICPFFHFTSSKP